MNVDLAATALALWPVAAVIVAAVLRMLERAVVLDVSAGTGPLPRRDELLAELLAVASQALIVAAGVGFALLWGRR